MKQMKMEQQPNIDKPIEIINWRDFTSNEAIIGKLRELISGFNVSDFRFDGKTSQQVEEELNVYMGSKNIPFSIRLRVDALSPDNEGLRGWECYALSPIDGKHLNFDKNRVFGNDRE
jgi:hypothetical protein